MAKRLQAKKITDALQKAQRVGEVEERFTITGCEVVLRNLLPEEFEAIIGEFEELEDLAYVNAFKKGHLCRSLIELNGESLREYDFVEVDIEEVDPVTKVATPKTINLERYKFVLDYVLSTWSREAIDVAYRKFLDLTSKSESEAAKGVDFILPDETADEKFRRILVEVKELEGQIPFELAKRILDEVGYVAKSSKEELENVEQVLSKVAAEVDAPMAPEAPQSVVTPAPALVAPPSQGTDLKSVLQSRVPLNQRSVAVPVAATAPVHQPSPETDLIPAVVGAVPTPRMIPGQSIPVSPAAMKRAQEIGSLEGMGSVDMPAITGGSHYLEATRLGDGVPTLDTHEQGVDQTGIASILNKPPSGGINPRYRPPPRF
jgi:hypothetical protein